MKKMILHTVAGKELPVETEVYYPWLSNEDICRQAVKAFNDAGINDKVLYAEIVC